MTDIHVDQELLEGVFLKASSNGKSLSRVLPYVFVLPFLLALSSSECPSTTSYPSASSGF